MFSFLRDFGPVSAYEVYPPCVAECRRRGYVEVFDSDPSIFSQKSKFALIGAFDVLEHIENDVDVLSRLYGAIRPGGIVVATVPAHQFLWSSHDVLNHHFRRHSKASLQRLFEESGFEVVTISYWNCLLFPLAACMRLLGVGGHETLMPSHAVNILLTRLLYLESLLLSFVPLPMGLSLVVVARRTV
jgi:trans-aconitate methyltransferase